jgi:hypothetical protein
MKKHIAWIVGSAFSLVACGGATENTDAANNEVSKTPTHFYAEKEGDNYLYIAGLSEDDLAAGKKAADVSTVRYAGLKNGVYTLQMIGGDDTVLGTAECTNPCKIVTLKVVGQVERVAYSDESVMGAAFQDAFNGFLETTKR